MTPLPVAITDVGMVTGVGINASASCAAVRGALDNFQETRFMDSAGEWIMGCEVKLEQPWRGRTKLLKMAATAINECMLANQRIVTKETPLLLCLSEHERKGRVIDEDNQFFLDLQNELGMTFHTRSRVIANGHVAVPVALQHARQLLQERHVSRVLIAATDSLLVASTLSHYEQNERLLTSQNSNGFIPGEAGAALVVEPASQKREAQLLCHGLGFGIEKSHVDSEEPLRADGLTAAVKEALNDAGCDMGDLDFRITDLSGAQYYFKEASLVLLRLLRKRKEEFDIWHPADCIGEIGAGTGLVMIAVLKAACEKGYTRGHRILGHLGNDDGKRSSMILSWRTGGDR